MKDSRSLLAGFGFRHARTAGIRTLHVAALYDGFITAVYAHEAVESLAMAVRPTMNMETSVWSFDMLARLDLRHPSIRVASEADVLIIAADASVSLPAHVKSWLTLSLRGNGKGAPLIVAIHEEDMARAEAAPPLQADLAGVAEQWGTLLLCNGEFDERLGSGLVAELAGRRSNDRPGFDFGDLLSASPIGRWGINE